MTDNIIINPSILSANFCNLEKDFKEMKEAGIKQVHIDVMDGNYVPNITFGWNQISMLKKITDMKFDVHLMIQEPDRFIGNFVEAGADCITVHVEACTHLYRTIQNIKSYGIEAGAVLNPATSLSELDYVLTRLDKILVMTVNPGFGGQKFIVDMKQKIKDVRKKIDYTGFPIILQVDGGINKDNLKEIVEIGATDIVMGSAVFKNEKIKRNICEFYDILNR